MNRRIVVTTEGTDIEHAAIRHAAGLTRVIGARLTLLHIAPDAPRQLDSGNDLSLNTESIEQAWAREAERLLAESAQDANCVRLTPVQRPAQGRDIPHAILQEAAALGADLLVMATHGRKGLAHLLLGSVADRVVHDATLPVMIVHAGTPLPTGDAS